MQIYSDMRYNVSIQSVAIAISKDIPSFIVVFSCIKKTKHLTSFLEGMNI